MAVPAGGVQVWVVSSVFVVTNLIVATRAWHLMVLDAVPAVDDLPVFSIDDVEWSADFVVALSQIVGLVHQSGRRKSKWYLISFLHVQGVSKKPKPDLKP